jgi:DNA-binding NarL/FixJ family response regulator
VIPSSGVAAEGSVTPEHERQDGGEPLVAIDDPSPTFRRGLAHVLREAGMFAVEPADLRSWVGPAAHRAVVMTVDGPARLHTITDLVDRQAALVVVALVQDLEGDAAAAALRAGAAAVAHHDDLPDRLIEVVSYALNGDALLPVDLARVLAHSPPVGAAERIGLTADEVGWIDDLARNRSVARIAADAGVSERTMYRRLDHLFHRIGVHNRIEAVAWATRNRYLDP